MAWNKETKREGNWMNAEDVKGEKQIKLKKSKNGEQKSKMVKKGRRVVAWNKVTKREGNWMNAEEEKGEKKMKLE